MTPSKKERRSNKAKNKEKVSNVNGDASPETEKNIADDYIPPKVSCFIETDKSEFTTGVTLGGYSWLFKFNQSTCLA